MEYSVSTLKTNTIQAATGSNIAIASGSVLQAPGHVLQTKSVSLTDEVTITSQTQADIHSNLSMSITPSSTSNKILISYNVTYGINGDVCHGYLYLVRNSTNLLVGTASGSRDTATHVFNIGNNPGSHQNVAGFFLDSPNTTSAVTYKLQCKTSNSNAVYINRSGRDTDNVDYDGRGTSTFLVQEIAG